MQVNREHSDYFSRRIAIIQEDLLNEKTEKKNQQIQIKH